MMLSKPLINRIQRSKFHPTIMVLAKLDQPLIITKEIGSFALTENKIGSIMEPYTQSVEVGQQG